MHLAFGIDVGAPLHQALGRSQLFVIRGVVQRSILLWWPAVKGRHGVAAEARAGWLRDGTLILIGQWLAGMVAGTGLWWW
jgi:hypothetical protein